MSLLALISPLSLGLAVLAGAALVAGAIAAAAAVYLLLLSVAALLHRDAPPQSAPTARLLVLIPAHDEAALITRCVRSLRAQAYPSELYQIVVVADNCTDDTASLAAAAGADLVMRRDEPQERGKGRALRWAMDRLLSGAPAFDGIVVVDADTVADPNFLRALVAPFEAGASAVQGESLLYGDGSTKAALRVAAFLLINRARPTGRAVLRLPAAHLSGNGMLIAREVLLAHPWSAFTSAEDVEYSLDLQTSGIRIAFAPGAILMSPTAPTPQAAAQQQLRWEGGKVHLARVWIPRLILAALRDHSLALLDSAFDLAIPPLGFLAATVLAGSAATAGLVLAGAMSGFVLIPWVAASVAIALQVVIGLHAAGASRSEYWALLGAPLFILAKPFRAGRVLGFRGETWIRTEREAEAEVGNEV